IPGTIVPAPLVIVYEGAQVGVGVGVNVEVAVAVAVAVAVPVAVAVAAAVAVAVAVAAAVAVAVGVGVGLAQGRVATSCRPDVRVPAVLHSNCVKKLPVSRWTPTVALEPPWATSP